MFKSWLCYLALCVLPLCAAAADPDEVSATDAKAVRALVEKQLGALAQGRPAEAFSYASPSIQAQFNDATAFADMVERSYPMLIRPASIGFFKPAAHEGEVFQAVHFRDRDGHLWRAVYELQRQPDRSWRINGCAVAPDDEASTT